MVREDPAQQGVLYAGTEAGMFVSYNDGDDWQSLKLNLPPVPITDLTIRHDNLVAATQGRGFWVLDDLSMVREAAGGISEKALHVFSPGTISMLHARGSAGDNEGSNPERGVPIYYYLADDLETDEDSPLTIEVLDQSGQVLRLYSSEESDFDRCRLGNMDPRRPFEIDYPPTSKGLHSWTWDTLQEGVTCIDDIALFAGFDGPGVTPGDYRIRVTAGNQQQTVPVTLTADPRTTASPAAIQEWSSKVEETAALLSEVLTGLGQLRESGNQIDDLMNSYPDRQELQQIGTTATQKIAAWDAEINQVLHETYEDEDAWETKLAGQIRFLLDVINETGAPVTEGALQRLADLKAEWQTRKVEMQDIQREYINVINDWAREQGIPHVGGP